jgi:hypothetical protein
MRTAWRMVLAAWLTATMEGAATAAITVPLTVTERAHVARSEELAAGGVPLPRGAAKDTKDFGVLDADGKPAPAQFTVLNRWPDDGSIRWMLVEFLVSLDADGTKTFTLRQGAENPAPAEPIRVMVGAEQAAARTGGIQIEVRPGGFRLPNAPDGFAVTTAAGETYTTAADAQGQVTLEDGGPLRATFRYEGRHKNTKGESLLAYRVRLHVISRARGVRLQYAYIHDTGPYTNTPVDIKELTFAMRANAEGPITAFFGGSGKTHECVLKADERLRLSVGAADEYRLSGALTDKGPVKAAKDLNLGWCALTDGKGAGTFAVRWFWQLYPKALSIKGDGSVAVELISPDAVEPVHVYRGMAKTHDLLLVQQAGAQPAREAAVAFQQPLFVKCPPAWYCQDTLGFGRLVSSDYKGLPAEQADFVRKVDDGFVRQIEVIRNARDEIVDGKLKQDSYGLVHFGDGFHHRASSTHQGLQWDNCYYEYTHLLAMQFARSGSDVILDTLREAARFEGDSAIAWEADGTAGPRVNPGGHHVGGFGAFQNAPSGSWNFYKPIGMLQAFHLTGDRRYEDAGLANLNWMLTHDGYDMYNNPRSVGSGLRAAAYGYLATGNRDFLAIARDVARKAERFYRVHGDFAPVRNSIFMCPGALEGLCVYQDLTGDPHLAQVLPAMVAAHVTKYSRNPANLEYAYANLFTARLAGDEALRKSIADALAANGRFSIQSGEHAVKDFAASKRGVPPIFWCLSDLATSPPKPWGNVDLGPERADRVDIAGPSADGKGTPIDLVSSPNVAKAPAAPTRLTLKHDNRNLYLSVQATEPAIDLLRVAVKDDGGPVYNDDCVEIYVGPDSRRFGVKLMVNAAGVRAVGIRGHYPKEAPHVAPADFPVTAAKSKDAWRLDVTIPFAKVGLADPQPGAPLAFNVIRFRVGNTPNKPGESSTWHGTSNQIESVGTLILGR